MFENKITRRRALSTAAAAGAVVGVGLVAGVGGYLAGSSAGGQTVTQRETVTVGGQTVTIRNTITQPVTVTQTVAGGRTPPRDRILLGASLSLTGVMHPLARRKNGL
jgi:hypothetical protein